MPVRDRRGIYVNSPPPLLRQRQQRQKAKLVAKYRITYLGATQQFRGT